MREEFGTPVLYKSFSVKVPSVGVLGGRYSGLEILHGGVGGDVEQGARTSKHILVFAFDPLVSLTLSLIIVQSIFHIIISYLLVLSIIHIAISYHICLCIALHLSYCCISIICLACLSVCLTCT